MADRILTYNADGTEITSFSFPDLSGKTILGVFRAGQYRRAIVTDPNDDEEIRVTGDLLLDNGGIVSTTGEVKLKSGDGLLLNEKLDFLHHET